ncbi:MAG TPA: hypothetical protein VMU42_19025 [Candidatus Sulfotelmatobacter sp.]|nr:hypothetical protein [Candidatus Sulfotelmatobacter sp.]
MKHQTAEATTAGPTIVSEGPPSDARRRAALARLGLAATAVYAAPVILKLSPATAATSHCGGGNHGCAGGGNHP